MQVWKRILKRSKDNKRALHWTFGTMLVFGLAGLVSSFVLTVEKFHLLKNPEATLSCTFNLVLNCATVMQTWQAQVFGFPNSLIGIVGYSIVCTVAVAGLAGVRFPRWFLRTANIFYLLGALFAYWLFFQSVYVIQVLCPWCLVVTFSTTMVFAAITHYNLRENTFGFSSKLNKKVQNFIGNDYDKLVTAVWIVLLVGLVILKFGDALVA